MKITLNAARCALAVIALTTVSVFAQSARTEGDSDDSNHYILECGGPCQPALVGSAIGPGHTGAWYDPEQSGHGLFVEVLPDNKIQAAWFTFNPTGTEQAWFVGVGTYDGSTATIAVVEPTGGRWIPNFDPHQVVNNAWGTLTLTFSDSNHGRVDFNSTLGYGAGSMNLTRLTQPLTPNDSGWIFTGSLNIPRSRHTATVLRNGMVLVAGGYGSNGIIDSAELYDPSTGMWSSTGSMSAPRVSHTATLLPSGKVLVVGGETSDSPPTFGRTNTAELYDPATGTWILTGSLRAASSWDTATLLQNGKVLVTGGYDDDNVNTTEVYDPAPGVWSRTGSLIKARYGQTATLLQDGRVLVARGSDDGDLASTLASAELYDPVAGMWSATQSSAAGSVLHTATLLPNGKVLVAGGNGGGVGGDTILALSNLFDPATGSWSAAGNLATARYAHTATLLPTGEVLVTGGTSQQDHFPNLKFVNLDSAEIYDSHAGAWTSAGNLNAARGDHTATLLSDGRVLVAGGSIVGPSYDTIVLDTAEVNGVAQLPGAIRPGMTGAWYDPAQSGHGLFVEVLPDGQFLAAWFAFNPSGTQQSWFLGVGTYNGNTATVTAVYLPTGGRWIPNFDPSQVVNNAWGTLTFTFTDCNHGEVDFTSTLGYGSGSVNLTRLTQPTGFSCP
jgi:hypothetical protein